MDVIVFLLIFSDCFLKAGRYKEVLLFQSQLFTCIVIVVWIKNLYDIAGKVLLLYCFLVVTLVKGIQLEVYDRLCIPDTESIYHIIVIACDRHIIRNSFYCLVSFVDKSGSTLFSIIFCSYIAAEMYFLGIFRTTEFEWIAVFQPVIRYLNLVSVFDLLFEHSVMVTDSTAICSIV